MPKQSDFDNLIAAIELAIEANHKTYRPEIERHSIQSRNSKRHVDLHAMRDVLLRERDEV